MFATAALGIVAGSAAAGVPPDRIVVDAARIVREVPPDFLGINVNYFLDDDRNAASLHQGRPARPLAEALKEMGVKRLRYPGGDKSDNHLWSRPPFDRPRPTVLNLGTGQWVLTKRDFLDERGEWVADPLDFDEFIALCRAVGAAPVVVVCFDAMYADPRPGFTPPTRQELLDTAVAWVRYANVTKGYGVRDWEIGNESYHGDGQGLPTAEEYGRDAALFARAMKAVDPSIRIGLNGPGGKGAVGARDRKDGRTTPWWPTVLPLAGRDADFIAAHTYPTWEWGGYDYYPAHAVNLGREADGATEMIRALCGPEDAARLTVAMTEVNAMDWAPKEKAWPNTNDLGHALTVADMVGKFLWNPGVECALLWNTRWFDGASPKSVCDAVDPANGLNPTGQALAAWSGALASRVVWTEGSAMVPAYACADGATGAVNLLLINKGRAPRAVEVALAPTGRRGPVPRRVLRGTGPDDPDPRFTDGAPVRMRGGRAALTLDPVSLTVLSFPSTSGGVRRPKS